MDAYRVGNRLAFNKAFEKLGLDCANWTEPIYADLLRSCKQSIKMHQGILLELVYQRPLSLHPSWQCLDRKCLPRKKRFGHCYSVADSDQLATDASNKDFGNAENSAANDQQLTSMNPSDENSHLQGKKVNAESGSQTSEGSSGSINQKEGSAASPSLQSTAKRSSQTARERLRAA